ncbi:MAG TPA: Hsp20/alpha crystallin family protein, partial [Mucilaginibacter sp.]
RNNTAFFSFCGLNGSLKNVKFSHLIFGIFIEVGKIESKKQKEDIMTNIIKKENAQPATFGSVVDRLFQNNLHRFFDDDFFGFNGVQSLNNVPVNIRETDKAYELELIAPGLRKEDFHLNLSGDVLTVSFEHAEEKQDEGKNQSWLRREYKKAAFTRSFNLDDTVDASKAAAHYQDGVLRLSLPKKESAQKLSRTIAVQ